MKLRELYEKLYERIFSEPFFKKLLEKLPFLEKVLKWEIISYLIFGLLTTVVNLFAYWFVNLFAGGDYETKVLFTVKAFEFRWIYFANAVAWVVAVLFSYVTNKLFVFESRAKDAKTVTRELTTFFGARILSFLLFEELLFGLLAHFMNSWIAKILIAVFVVVFNYIMSKLVIFRKKKDAPAENAPEEEET